MFAFEHLAEHVEDHWCASKVSNQDYFINILNCHASILHSYDYGRDTSLKQNVAKLFILLPGNSDLEINLRREFVANNVRLTLIRKNPLCSLAVDS